MSTAVHHFREWVLALGTPKDEHWEGRLFSTLWPLVGVVSVYLYFVLKAGPRMMANRPAYNLKAIIAIYNLAHIIGSSWGFLKVTKLVKGKFFIAHCKPNVFSQEVSEEINYMAYLYCLSKLLELLDTVFFVLRKKMNQVTFLHVYHHTNMALLSWVFLRAAPGTQLMIIGYCNSFVHILMYSYYFLTVFGPAVQKYLWWKKYLTKIQIIQFIVIIAFFGVMLLNPDCQISREFIILAICNTATFLILFFFFYTKKYSKKSSKLQ